MLDFEELSAVTLPEGSPDPVRAWSAVTADGFTVRVLQWGTGTANAMLQLAVQIVAPEGSADAPRFATLAEIHEAVQLLPRGAVMQLPSVVSDGRDYPPPVAYTVAELRQIAAKEGTPAGTRLKLSGGVRTDAPRSPTTGGIGGTH